MTKIFNRTAHKWKTPYKPSSLGELFWIFSWIVLAILTATTVLALGDIFIFWDFSGETVRRFIFMFVITTLWFFSINLWHDK